MRFTVNCEFGPVESFETLAEARAFCNKLNQQDGEGVYWVLHEYDM